MPTAAVTARLGPADGANGALGCAGLSRGFEAWVLVSIAEAKTCWAELAVDASPLDAVRHPRAQVHTDRPFQWPGDVTLPSFAEPGSEGHGS